LLPIVIAAMLLAAAFPGNGLYCFGSPAATGEILPFGKDQYVVEISVMLKGRTHAPVGWLYYEQRRKTVRPAYRGEPGNAVRAHGGR
jgi:hypothetical protein